MLCTCAGGRAFVNASSNPPNPHADSPILKGGPGHDLPICARRQLNPVGRASRDGIHEGAVVQWPQQGDEGEEEEERSMKMHPRRCGGWACCACACAWSLIWWIGFNKGSDSIDMMQRGGFRGQG